MIIKSFLLRGFLKSTIGQRCSLLLHHIQSLLNGGVIAWHLYMFYQTKDFDSDYSFQSFVPAVLVLLAELQF